VSSVTKVGIRDVETCEFPIKIPSSKMFLSEQVVKKWHV